MPETTATPQTWIASLGRADTGALVAHWSRLSPDCLHHRFLTRMGPREIEEQARLTLGPESHAVGWFVDGRLCGVAELHNLGNGHGEVAFTVDEPYRRRGIATRMMRRLLRRARNVGIRRVGLMTSRDNMAMIRLAARAGARLESDGPEVTGEITLAPATASSLFCDMADESQGAMAATTGAAVGLARAWVRALPRLRVAALPLP